MNLRLKGRAIYNRLQANGNYLAFQKPWPRPGSDGLELNSLHFDWDALTIACCNSVAPGQA